MAVVHPTYDGEHYRLRAERYRRAASLEPDPGVRSALEAVAEACRIKAAAVPEAQILDVDWKD